MLTELAAPSARFTFVAGKGGVGKSTTAALLALAWAKSGRPIHLVSTDPAHSLGDVLDLDIPADRPTPACLPGLTVEQPDLEQRSADWLARVRAPLAELLERGSYLDSADIELFTALRLPGIDEVMAAFRLAELAAETDAHVVVDTAPAGHTLRLLDAGAVVASWTRLLAALAAKADAVAGALVGARVRGEGDALLTELQSRLEQLERRVLADASFVVVTRAGEVVDAGTSRLLHALHARARNVRATVHVGAGDVAPGVLRLPWFVPPPRGCAALLAVLEGTPAGVAGSPGEVRGAGSGAAWLAARHERLLMFAGKGGVGKSTCAAAAAVWLARTRPVLLLGTDPAGSIGELFDAAVGASPVAVAPGVRAAQIDAGAALAGWRESLRSEASPLLARVGLGGDPALDRRVFEALWELAPPGLDELAALAELLEVMEEGETVVLDTAPTGHFLRLVALPETAQAWTRAVMRLLLKYGAAGELDALTRRVIAFARQVKSLRSRLADAGWAGAMVVTVEEPVVQAETTRLVAALARAAVPVSALLTNRHTGPAPPPGHASLPGLFAPLLAPPPRGPSGLARFAAQWEMQ